MAKWYGVIGYSETIETAPGVWTNQDTERNYYGEVSRNAASWSGSSEGTNDDLKVDSQISIVADPFAFKKFHSMKYIEFMGAKWKITKVEPKPPRLILTLGGVYNG